MIETIRSWFGLGNPEPLPMPAVKPEEGKRSPQWPKVRAEHLRKEPCCRACGAREKLEVHHIWPFSWPGGQGLELEPANLVTLCESPSHNCHLWVGHLGDYRSRNPDVLEHADLWRRLIANRPYPPN